MKFSEFESIVLASIIVGDAEEITLRNQLAVASVVKREYTGVGLFVTMQIPDEAPRMAMTNRFIERTPMVFLKHPELAPGGLAMLWFSEARISTLECVTMEGSWPKDESKFSVESYESPFIRKHA